MSVCDKAHAMVLLGYVQRRILKNCRENSVECALEEIEKIKSSLEEILIEEFRNL